MTESGKIIIQITNVVSLAALKSLSKLFLSKMDSPFNVLPFYSAYIYCFIEAAIISFLTFESSLIYKDIPKYFGYICVMDEIMSQCLAYQNSSTNQYISLKNYFEVFFEGELYAKI